MLKKLSYSVTFPSTGRTLSETVHFQDGFGAIVGPNESGKSMIIEMIRFCLFGTAALRGTTDEYKKLSAELSLDIKGEAYEILRTITSARVLRGDTEIAVGVRPSNEKVAQLLGFGLSVFDIACVANQDELIRLGAMRPADRQRMVDSVIGLGVLDDLAKSAGEEATGYSRRANDILESAREPILPLTPDGYRPSSDVAEERARLLTLKSEYDALQGWLSAEMAKPTVPVEEVPIAAAELQELVDKQNDLKNRRQALSIELSNLPQASPMSEEQIVAALGVAEQHAAYLRKRRFLQEYAQPTITIEQLEAMSAHLAGWKSLRQRQQLENQIDHLRSHSSSECPSCGHKWSTQQAEIDKLLNQIAQWPAVEPLHEVMPDFGPDDIDRHRLTIERWQAVADHWNEVRLLPDADVPSFVPVETLDGYRRANAAAVRRGEIELQIGDLDRKIERMPDYGSMLTKRLRFEAGLEAYFKQLAAYENWQEERATKLTRAVLIEADVAQFETVQALHDSCRAYEQALASYQAAKESFDELVSMANDFQSKAEEWRKVRVALVALRAMVKQHLVPSLNKVASHLIKQMTGGQRQTILVDEDFNILVDGQGLDTLSGSGKAVANLALRLGLGQVLTNNVFSLFMGDEIDASMDKDRAENTANTLQILQRKISQILLVTHKYPQADYYIRLGVNGEPEPTYP